MALASDRISKPVKGKYFPLLASELATRVEALAFSVHSCHKRLPIHLENAAAECDRGYQLCSLLRMSYLAVFSLPDSVPHPLARKALDAALEKFSAIDQGPRLAVREQEFVVYRAFLASLGTLSITQHVVSAGSRSYLHFNKASQLSKAGRETKGQQELFHVKVA